MATEYKRTTGKIILLLNLKKYINIHPWYVFQLADRMKRRARTQRRVKVKDAKRCQKMKAQAGSKHSEFRLSWPLPLGPPTHSSHTEKPA